jgi:hypothetical protein
VFSTVTASFYVPGVGGKLRSFEPRGCAHFLMLDSNPLASLTSGQQKNRVTGCLLLQGGSCW